VKEVVVWAASMVWVRDHIVSPRSTLVARCGGSASRPTLLCGQWRQSKDIEREVREADAAVKEEVVVSCFIMVYLGAVGAGLRWRLRAKRKFQRLGFPLALAKFNT
jgi:hypothetical protein